MRRLRKWGLVSTMVTSHAVTAQILPSDPAFGHLGQERLPRGARRCGDAAGRPCSTMIDAFSCEASITAADIVGFTAPMNLVEGSAATVADSNTSRGSLLRLPNGADTNNTMSGWTFSATPTPGAANALHR